MSTSGQNLLDSFDLLPKEEKREVAYEIIRRALNLDLPPLSYDELVSSAEEIFLELDRRERENEQP
jgi:hypothetical protein